MNVIIEGFNLSTDFALGLVTGVSIGIIAFLVVDVITEIRMKRWLLKHNLEEAA